MKAEIKKLPKSQVELTIEVSPVEMEADLKKAAEKISADTNIPGFRPGKAPYEIVKQKFGEMAILQEALDDIISRTYYEAVKENKIVSIGQPKIDIEKMAPENPLIYKAVVSVLPAIKIGDYQKLKIKKEKAAVKPEAVDQVIADIRKMRAKETLADKAAEKDNKLEIDFDVYLDKVPIDHGSQKKYPITIGEGRFIPGFEEKLIGMKAGEEKRFELKFPETYFEKKLAGKQAEFKVKCNQVFKVEPPALNDEFAKNISNGQFKDVAEMKENILKNLTEEEQAKQAQKTEQEMWDKVLAVCEFEELPEALVENEAHKMVHELEDNISQQGLAFEDYLKSINKTHDDLENDFRPAAEKRAKTAILAREIYNEQKFEVTEDEIEKEIGEMLKRYPANPEVDKQLHSEMYKDYLKNMIGNRKVAEYLKEIIISE